jgi:alpha-1,3-rhamnosyl/mannosyltransferase
MRIVVDVRTISDHFPGVGRYTYNLVRALARQIDRDELLLLSNPSLINTRFDLGSIISGSKVRLEFTASKPLTFGEQLRLPREIRRLNPGVTHFPHAIMPFAVRHPIVMNIQDIIPIRLPQYFGVRQRILYRVSLALALRSADLVICLSRATLSDLESVFRVDTSRFFVVPAAVDDSFRPCTGDELKRARAAHQLPDEYLLYVGSNKPHKNLPALIDAYARVPKAPPLVLAGKEDARYPQMRQRVEALGLTDRVRFLGAFEENDLPALYGGARAFVFPSVYEGFGFPPLEAMACGAPAACSNIRSLRETTADAALLFDPKDPASIAEAIERLITDAGLRSDLRERGLRRAAEYSWDRAARQTLDIYHRAAK